MLEQIQPGLMKAHIGTEFEVLDDPSRIFSLRLTEVVEISKTEHNETFSLYFHGPLQPFMPQKIHRLRHEKLGELELFLVPIGQDKDGFQYEAAFNILM
jgi:hypothetical protein